MSNVNQSGSVESSPPNSLLPSVVAGPGDTGSQVSGVSIDAEGRSQSFLVTTCEGICAMRNENGSNRADNERPEVRRAPEMWEGGFAATDNRRPIS